MEEDKQANPPVTFNFRLKEIVDFLQKNIGAPILLLVVICMLTIPLPPFLLDILFTFNIIMSLTVLMVCIHVQKPIDFSIFPTVILVSTLLRLGLNVASTRVILIYGQNGPGSAGHVIESFGSFVIGGNYVVGMIVFIVLVIINFIVIIKGAERVSEVNARFTLDSMPGKQMAVDADLNAGYIDQKQAGERRKSIAEEAEFHGSMDGASKFIKGDAIAAIAILIVNLIGGFSVGIIQHSLSFSEAVRCYISLSIGDGLVAQIPSLIMSTATAITITRISRAYSLSKLVAEQMFSKPKVLTIVSVIIIFLGVIPGMPHLVFLMLAAINLAIAFFIRQKGDQKNQEQLKKETLQEVQKTHKNFTIKDVQKTKPIALEVGYRLINLVGDQEKSNLLTQIGGVRKDISKHFGFLIPPVDISDNPDLEPNHYNIKIRDITIAKGEVMASLLLALDDGNITNKISGIETKDPTFGIDAVWIRENQKEEAESAGYSVVDSSTVLATHLRQILIENIHLLFSHNDLFMLIEETKKTSPKLIDELTPKLLSLSSILRVLRDLLSEQVPIKDFTSICESLAEFAPQKLNTTQLTQLIRKSMGGKILQNIVGDFKHIHVVTLEPELESIIHQGLQENNLNIEPNLAKKLYQNLEDVVKKQMKDGRSCILLVSSQLRSHLASILLPHIKMLHVLAYEEIPTHYHVSVIEQVSAK